MGVRFYVLESLRQSSPWLQNKADIDHAEDLLSRMLGGLDCGTPIRPAHVPVHGMVLMGCLAAQGVL